MFNGLSGWTKHNLNYTFLHDRKLASERDLIGIRLWIKHSLSWKFVFRWISFSSVTSVRGSSLRNKVRPHSNILVVVEFLFISREATTKTSLTQMTLNLGKISCIFHVSVSKIAHLCAWSSQRYGFVSRVNVYDVFRTSKTLNLTNVVLSESSSIVPQPNNPTKAFEATGRLLMIARRIMHVKWGSRRVSWVCRMSLDVSKGLNKNRSHSLALDTMICDIEYAFSSDCYYCRWPQS